MAVKNQSALRLKLAKIRRERAERERAERATSSARHKTFARRDVAPRVIRPAARRVESVAARPVDARTLERVIRKAAMVGRNGGDRSAIRELQNANAALEQRVKAFERSQRSRNVSLPGVEDGGTVRGKRVKFMFTKAFGYLLDGREEGREFEVEVLKQTAKLRTKTMIAGNDALGGSWVPQQVMQDLIENIRANAVVLQAGATLLSGLTGSPVTMPKLTGSTTGRWLGEVQAGTPTDIATGQLTMTPKTAQASTKLSKRLIMMANQAAEQIVRDDLTRTLALMIDSAALRGTGGANTPLGVANTPGILSLVYGTNGADISWDLLIDQVQKLRAANSLMDSKRLAWITSSALVGVLQKLRDGNDRPLLVSPDRGAADEIWQGKVAGYPMFDTTQVPSDLTKGTGTALTELYFGDWTALLIGQWGGMEIDVTDQAGTAWENREVWIQAHQDLDVAVRQGERFCLANDVKTT